MATIAEQLTSLANTKTAIKDAIVAKGVTVADTDPFSAYPAKIGEIQGGGGAPATKFGVNIDALLGDVDEKGTYVSPTKTFTFDASSIVWLYIPSTSTNRLQYFMAGKTNLVGTIDLSNLMGAKKEYDLSSAGNLFEYGFSGTGISEVILPSVFDAPAQLLYLKNTFANNNNLTRIVIGGGFKKGGGVLPLQYTFANCPNIQDVVGLENIERIVSGGMVGTFSGSNIQKKEWFFSSLESIGSSGCEEWFKGASGIEKIYFPALTQFDGTQPFGWSSTTSAFYNCTSITEIHFRADMQATVEALSRYSQKFGATNATIYFDL